MSNLTGINRMIIERIEHEDFIPSIHQFEILANALEFNITDMFIDKQKNNSFIALRNEALNKGEKEGVDKFFMMILALKQQILLRRKFENKTKNNV